MSEQDKRSIEELLTDNAARKQAHEKEQLVRHEQQRVSIEGVARKLYQAYLEEYRKLEPDAIEAFGVIRNWFTEDILKTGLYQKLFDWNPHFVLNDPFEFEWPYLAIKEISQMEQTGTKSFQSFTRIASNPFDPIGANQRARRETRDLQNQRWEAEYRLKNHRFDTGLYIWIDSPRARKPIWKAPIYNELDIGVISTEVGDLLPNLHPVVLTKFAEQIKSNRVWERIQQTIKSS